MQVSHGGTKWILVSRGKCHSDVAKLHFSAIKSPMCKYCFHHWHVSHWLLGFHKAHWCVEYTQLRRISLPWAIVATFSLFSFVVRDMTQDCVAQLRHGTSDSYHAAAACWKTARCLRWSNEPCEQETATHAIGIAFENRKGTCSLLMGVFLWHDRRRALCLAVIMRKRYEFWYGNGAANIQAERGCLKVSAGLKLCTTLCVYIFHRFDMLTVKICQN